MEGRDRKARVAALKARRDPLAQIAGRLAREGENEQLVRSRQLLVDQPDGAFDDDPRLPEPGPARTRAAPRRAQRRPIGARLALLDPTEPESDIIRVAALVIAFSAALVSPRAVANAWYAPSELLSGSKEWTSIRASRAPYRRASRSSGNRAMKQLVVKVPVPVGVESEFIAEALEARVLSRAVVPL